eukprot:885409-Amphidinium_carterae.1
MHLQGDKESNEHPFLGTSKSLSEKQQTTTNTFQSGKKQKVSGASVLGISRLRYERVRKVDPMCVWERAIKA